MKATKILLPILLTFAGCNYDAHCALPDSGLAPEADAGMNEPPLDDAGMTALDAGDVATLDSVTACRLFGYAGRHLTIRCPGDEVCEIPCPWPGSSGPGLPEPEVCDLERVLPCIDAIAATNDCAWIDESLELCDPDACAPRQQ